MVKADSIGKGLGGFFSSPFGLGLLALGAIFIFRDKISSFFQSGFDAIGGGLGDININLPAINLPDFNLYFGGFDFGDPFKGVQESLDKIITQFTNPLDPGREEGSLQEQVDTGVVDVIPDVTGGLSDRGLRGSDPGMEVIPDELLTERFLPVDFNLERTAVAFGTEIIVPAGDELGFGGGLSFIGGTTTFGDNLVDTFTEALAIFPDLRASQISDLLASNQGLTGSQFALIDPRGDINISSEGVDQPQQLNVSSGGFTGLTPEQISALISGL